MNDLEAEIRPVVALIWALVLMLTCGVVGFTIAKNGVEVFWAFVWGLLAAVAIQQIGLAVRKGTKA